MKNNKKILVTGGNGFIGSNLIRKLINEGIEVGMIKRENSNLWKIKDILNKIVIYETDLNDTYKVSKIISHFKPDAIFHLAAYYAVEHKPQEIHQMIDTNVLGTVNLLEASIESRVKLFVNTSSCFVYKEKNNKLKESSDLSPLNLYALTKIQGEQACSFYAENYGLSAITFRLFPPYGPYDNEKRLIPYVIKNMLYGKKIKLTSGKQRWDFVYVGDIVDAYLRLLYYFELTKNHEIFNIGSGEAFSVREVVLKIKEIINSEVELEWNAIPHRRKEAFFICADAKKIENILKWKPKIKIDEGLSLTIKWYKEFLKKRRQKNGKNN